MRAKFINEFERGVKPKKSLGIGKYANINPEILNAYEVLKQKGHTVDFPKPNSNRLQFINKDGISMELVAFSPSNYTLYVYNGKDEDKDDIPFPDLTLGEAINAINRIDEDWLDELYDEENDY